MRLLVIVLVLLLPHTRWLLWHETEIFGFSFKEHAWFREGKSHTPTLNPALIFNWIGTTKRPFALYVYREQWKQTFGKIYLILSCWKCVVPLDKYTLFLGTFSLNNSSFFLRCLICPVFFRVLSWMLLFT